MLELFAAWVACLDAVLNFLVDQLLDDWLDFGQLRSYTSYILQIQ